LEALVNLRTVDTTHRNLHNTVLSNSLFEKLFLFGNQFNNEALLEVSLHNGEKLGDNGKIYTAIKQYLFVASPMQ